MSAFPSAEVEVKLVGSNITLNRIKTALFPEYDDYPRKLSLGQARAAVVRLEEALDPEHPRTFPESVTAPPDYSDESALERYLDDLKRAVADAERFEQEIQDREPDKREPDGQWQIRRTEDDSLYRGPFFTERSVEKVMDKVNDEDAFYVEQVE